MFGCRFPPAQHPVLTFKGAPASFPVHTFNRDLQRYVVWNNHIREWTEDYVQREMSGEPYIAVHLRIGSDWVRLASGYSVADIVIEAIVLAYIAVHLRFRCDWVRLTVAQSYGTFAVI